MSGLHRPVVVDPQLENFRDVELDVHCVPGGLLKTQEASALCQKVGSLFENQGGLVTTHIAEGRFEDEFDEGESEEASTVPRTGLSLELRAREVHESKHPLSWVFCIVSLTLVPGVTESTFAQDIVIRDDTGFLLVSDSLQGRLVTRFGAGTWVGNKLLDWAWRDDADKLTGEVVHRDLSNDLYRQLSQLTFNAHVKAQVLRQSSPPVRE